MQNATKDRVFQVRGPQVSKSLLAAAALFLILATVARAQQAEEQKGAESDEPKVAATGAK